MAIPGIGMMITLAAVSASPAQSQTTITLGSPRSRCPVTLLVLRFDLPNLGYPDPACRSGRCRAGRTASGPAGPFDRRMGTQRQAGRLANRGGDLLVSASQSAVPGPSRVLRPSFACRWALCGRRCLESRRSSMSWPSASDLPVAGSPRQRAGACRRRDSCHCARAWADASVMLACMGVGRVSLVLGFVTGPVASATDAWNLR